MKPMGYERQSWWSDEPMVYITRRVSAREAPADRSRLRSAGAPHRADAVRRLDAAQRRAARRERGGVQQLRRRGIVAQRQIARLEAADRRRLAAHLAGDLGARHAPGGVPEQAPPRDELRTAGKAAAVVLKVDRPRLAATWDDVAYVTAEVVDEQGVVVPSAANEITFAVTGPGVGGGGGQSGYYQSRELSGKCA